MTERPEERERGVIEVDGYKRVLPMTERPEERGRWDSKYREAWEERCQTRNDRRSR